MSQDCTYIYPDVEVFTYNSDSHKEIVKLLESKKIKHTAWSTPVKMDYKTTFYNEYIEIFQDENVFILRNGYKLVLHRTEAVSVYTEATFNKLFKLKSYNSYGV